MITTKYKKIFQLDFQHDYFNHSNALKIFKMGTILNGSPSTGLKETENGYFAFMPSPHQKPKDKSKEETPEWTVFGFSIQIEDASFFNFTDIEFKSGHIFYLNNEQAKNSVIHFSDALSLPVFPSQFTYDLTGIDQHSLKAIRLEVPNKKSWNLPMPKDTKQNTYPIDLRGELAGKYQLTFEFSNAENSKKYTFFYSDQYYKNPPPIVFEWLGEINETNNNFLSYTILFSARSTYWRYNFVNIDQQDWEEISFSSITKNDQTISFSKDKQIITLPNGQTAFVALSNAPIPLQERPNWNLRLRSKRWPNGIVLPYPQGNDLSLLNTEEGNSKYCSNIYFTL